jgi:hypothetical protein
MKLCLAIVVCLSAMAWRPTYAVNCSAKTSFTCVESDFTLATCNLTTGACDCYNNNVYTAIPTGCARKLQNPSLKTVDYMSQEFFPGSPVQLYCRPSDEATMFVWRRDGKVITGVTSGLYNITGLDDDKTGGFTCRVVDGTEQSEDSNTVVITEVSQLGLKELAIVSDIPPYAVVGDTIDVKCSKIPFGATYKFMIDNNPKLVDTVTHDPKIKNITCVIDVPQGYTNTIKNMTGVTASVYIQDANDIYNVRIYPGLDQTYRTGTPVNVTCETEPEEKYLAGGNTVTYTFMDYSNGSAIAYGNVYPVLSTTGSHKIACSAKYGNKAPKFSYNITVEFSDKYLATPVLSASSTTVAIGSNLVLTCVDGRDGPRDVYIYWTKDDKIIPRQRDRIIQFGDFQESDAGRFACTAIKDRSTAVSNEITVRANADSLRALGSTLLLVLVAMATSKIF